MSNIKFIGFAACALLAALCAWPGIARSAEYMVFDLHFHQVIELDAPPDDLLTNDAYKTTKMVFRRIPAGKFTMNGGQLEVTITRDFYIGVFQCTQAQWEAIMGTAPSNQAGTYRPVENVSNRGGIVGDHSVEGLARGGELPGEPNPYSFLGRLRGRFAYRFNFDFPTEFQWEYAARAGTESDLNSGENLSGDISCDNLAQLGRYYFNRNDGRGGNGYTTHTTVGSYRPNAWGLYDMHGNVWEMCLGWDRYPDGPLVNYGDIGRPGTIVQRGGAWSSYAWFCHHESRRNSGADAGFRVAFEIE